MKRIIMGVSILFLLSSPVLAEDDQIADNIKAYVKEAIKESDSKCPKTTITGQDQCLKCHVVGSFAVKELNLKDLYAYPNSLTKIIHTEKERIGYFFLSEIDSQPIQEFFDYMTKQDINHVIIDIHSPGGSLFCGIRTVGIMSSWEARKDGRIVETRCSGFAASAGFLVFIGGTKGYRMASSHAEFMNHQLLSFSMLKISTPASSEEETRVLKHLQNNIDTYVASRGHMTKEEIDDRIKNKEHWMTGEEALKFGFVDKLL